jgi:hypothetical protein
MESMVIAIVSRLTFWFFWFTLNREDKNKLRKIAKSGLVVCIFMESIPLI